MTRSYTGKVFVLAVPLLVAATAAAVGIYFEILSAAALNCCAAEASRCAPNDGPAAVAAQRQQPVNVLVAYHTLRGNTEKMARVWPKAHAACKGSRSCSRRSRM